MIDNSRERVRRAKWKSAHADPRSLDLDTIGGGPMATDKYNFPHMFFLPLNGHIERCLAAAGRRLSRARRLAGQARAGRSEA